MSSLTEERVRAGIEKEFGQRVQIGSFTKRSFPPGCDLENVKIGDSCSIASMHIRGSYAGMTLPPHRMTEIVISGMRIWWKPGEKILAADKAGSRPPVATFRVEQSVLLVGDRTDPHAEPLQFRIHSIVVRNSTWNAALTNAMPPGEIVAAGTFGHFDSRQIGAFPVTGEYTFSGANLDVFSHLAGTLFAKGNFKGPLGRLFTAGTVQVAKFHIEGASAPVDLDSTYRATVDGPGGDVALQMVETRAGRCLIDAAGDVIDGTVRLHVEMKQGRVDDLLRYFSTQHQPSMSGDASLQANIVVPPGPGFLRKISVRGDFELEHARFTKQGTQDAIDNLAKSAEGEKKETRENDRRVTLLAVKAHTEVSRGLARLTRASLSAEGMTAQVAGTFNLLDKSVNMEGVLNTTGSLGDSAHGFRALALHVIAPLYRKNHESVVPFKIRGTSSAPLLSLEMPRHR